MAKPAVPHYSTLQIGLHWAIAALVMFQIVFGEAMVRFVDAAEEGGAVSATDTVLANAHYWSGSASTYPPGPARSARPPSPSALRRRET